jgi:predicted MPP superfamily phosphohydrolase
LKYINIIYFIIFSLCVYAFGLYSGSVKLFPYEILKNIYLSSQSKISRKNASIFNSCSIDEISVLPKNFSIIIGHAYGRHTLSNSKRFLSPKIHHFILDHMKSIDSLIFTGDVFYIPNSRKWKALYEELKPIKIFIAPGNHDIGRPNSKEIFFKNRYIKDKYPYFIKTQELDILIDNSINKRWLLEDKLVQKINSWDKDLLIARHDTPINELKPLTNESTKKSSSLISIKDFSERFIKDKNLTWIIGDSGAFKYLPRIACYEFENHRFIINGIGEQENDTVLILIDGNIFQYIIKNKS